VGNVTPRTCELGTPGPLRDRLVLAVLEGRKTATTSLLAEWEHEQEPLPAVGERQTVVASDGTPVAVIELLDVAVTALADADPRLAVDEGEGCRSVSEWRAAHTRFWMEEVVPRLPGAPPVGDDTLIVVERFRVVSRSSG
jgi:uncharacterized protein YhfF